MTTFSESIRRSTAILGMVAAAGMFTACGDDTQIVINAPRPVLDPGEANFGNVQVGTQ